LTEVDPVKLMKQEVGKAAAVRVQSGSIVGWVRGQRRRIQFSFGRSPQIRRD